jgi:hypothetical protein
MKKSFRLLNAALLAAGLSMAFTACNPETEVKTGMITFEDVTLDTSGVFNGKDSIFSFTSDILTCPVVCMEMNGFSWWSGIACSNHTNMETTGLANQYSVHASSGANGSEKFALIGVNGAPCAFNQPVKLKSLMVNNSTYDYWALKEGDDGGAGYVTKFKTGDYFNVTVTGYDSNNIQTGQVVIPLAEFRNNQSYICSDWTKISLEALGKVSILTFTFDSSDKSGEWLNTPQYVCIDNLVYEK